jgi:hypothetical protein
MKFMLTLLGHKGLILDEERNHSKNGLALDRATA